MEQWVLVWVLFTPGGDVLNKGVSYFSDRTECNMSRRVIEQRSFPMGQKIQAICLQRT